MVNHLGRLNLLRSYCKKDQDYKWLFERTSIFSNCKVITSYPTLSAIHEHNRTAYDSGNSRMRGVNEEANDAVNNSQYEILRINYAAFP